MWKKFGGGTKTCNAVSMTSNMNADNDRTGGTDDRSALYSAGRKQCLDRAYILPMYRIKGYGTRIIQGVVHDAEGTGHSIKLQMLKINPARKLHERLGFVVTGTDGPHQVMQRTPPPRRSL